MMREYITSTARQEKPSHRLLGNVNIERRTDLEYLKWEGGSAEVNGRRKQIKKYDISVKMNIDAFCKCAAIPIF